MSPTRSDSQAIVDAVVEAASNLPASQVTMRSLAERAGVGVASIYRFFPTKQAIYAEISRRLYERFVQDVKAVIASEPSLEQGVTAICHAAVVGQGTNSSLRRTLNLEVPQSWSHESAARAYSTVVDELERYLPRVMAVPAPRERVFMVFAALRGQLLLTLLYPDAAPSAERLVEEMTRTALLLLRAPGP